MNDVTRYQLIMQLTGKDDQDRLYYRHSPDSNWQPLKTAADYAKLNELLDALCAPTL